MLSWWQCLTIIQPLCLKQHWLQQAGTACFQLCHENTSESGVLGRPNWSGLCTETKSRAMADILINKWINKNKKVTQLLKPCCGAKTEPQNHDSLIHFLMWLNWNQSTRRYTQCKQYPHWHRDPISDCSRAFRVGCNLIMCHWSSQAQPPEDALDFTHVTTISVHANTSPIATHKATVKYNNSNHL